MRGDTSDNSIMIQIIGETRIKGNMNPVCLHQMYGLFFFLTTNLWELENSRKFNIPGDTSRYDVNQTPDVGHDSLLDWRTGREPPAINTEL